MPVTVQPMTDQMNRNLRMLVTVSEDVLFSERRFKELMTDAVYRAIDEAVRATMVKFGDAMNEVLSLDNLRNIVIAELQKRITEVKPNA